MDEDSLSCGTTSSSKSLSLEPLTPPPERARPCPLCSSEIKMFFLATNTVTLMCVNSKCEYPFGYEDFELIKLGDLQSLSSLDSGSTMTLSSSTAWSEIEKCCSVPDSEESDFEGMTEKFSKQKKGEDEPEAKKKKTEKKVKIKKDVDDIKELSNMLYAMKKGEATITDKKFAMNLYKLQGKTGSNFLKPAELEMLKRNKSLEQSNVTINIEQDPSRISSITIGLPQVRE